MVDIGVLQLGAQTIPIYPTISAEDYEYVINHSESIYCFVSDIEVYEKVKRIQSNTNIKEIYSFDHINGCKHISELIEEGSKLDTLNEVEQIKETIVPTDLATIIYTSGTTVN